MKKQYHSIILSLTRQLTQSERTLYDTPGGEFTSDDVNEPVDYESGALCTVKQPVSAPETGYFKQPLHRDRSSRSLRSSFYTSYESQHSWSAGQYQATKPLLNVVKFGGG